MGQDKVDVEVTGGSMLAQRHYDLNMNRGAQASPMCCLASQARPIPEYATGKRMIKIMVVATRGVPTTRGGKAVKLAYTPAVNTKHLEAAISRFTPVLYSP